MPIPLPDRLRPIEPELWGALDPPLEKDRPATLFPGDASVLFQREISRRARLWADAAPLLQRVLSPEERVLYVARGHQRMTIGMYFGLGWTALQHHQVLLVFTDSRLVEILLDFRGTGVRPRIRTYPWASVEEISLKVGSLRLRPASGAKRPGWTVATRGDRTVLKRLLPRMNERLRFQGGAAPAPLPLRHCPECGSLVERKALACAPPCAVRFKSARRAALLSLACPGAGLFYSGHPYLAALDFAGEVMVLIVFAVLLSSSSGGTEIAAAVGAGAFLVALTKFESIHIGNVLLDGPFPEPPGRAGLWRAVAVTGSVLSVAGFAGAFLLTGSDIPRLEQDLDFRVGSGEWSGSRAHADWKRFTDDPALRSEWTSRDGEIVSVFGYPLPSGTGMEAFRTGYLAQLRTEGARVTAEEPLPPGALEGFLCVRELDGKDGQPIAVVDAFVYDRGNSDVHQALIVAPAAESARAREALGGLLQEARWIPAAAPSGIAKPTH